MNQQSISKGTIALIVLIAGAVIMCWIPSIDQIASQQIDEGLHRALISFGIAKGLNLLISLFQSSQISIAFATLTIGEVLDPINDLVEQFSNVMLLASVAFGIQKLLVGIGGHIVVKSIVSALGIITCFLLATRRHTPKLLTNALVLALMIRLAIPVATIISSGIYQVFLEPQYATSSANLSKNATQLESLKSNLQKGNASAPVAEQPTTESDGLFGYKKVLSSLNPSEKIQQLSQLVTSIGEQMTTDIINQIVVFLLQTLIFPIGLIWVLYKISVSLMYRTRP